MAVKRVYAPARLHGRVVEALAERAKAVVVGAGLDEGTELGPLNNAAQLARVERYTARALAAGAGAAAGGHRLDRPGYFHAPTVLTDVPPDSPVVTEEQFGPVLPVLPYGTVDEAVDAANATRFGLGGSVWGTDLDRAEAVAGRLSAGRRGSTTTPSSPRPALRRGQGERRRRRGRAVGAVRQPQPLCRTPPPGGPVMRFDAAVLRSYEDPFAVEKVMLNAGPGTARCWSASRGAACAGPISPSGARRAAPAARGARPRAGVVVEAGGSGTGPVPGDHVVLSFDSCGHCRSCLGAAPPTATGSRRSTSSAAAPRTRPGSPTRPGRAGAPVVRPVLLRRIRDGPGPQRRTGRPLAPARTARAARLRLPHRCRSGPQLLRRGPGRHRRRLRRRSSGPGGGHGGHRRGAVAVAVDRHPERLALAEKFGATGLHAASGDLPAASAGSPTAARGAPSTPRAPPRWSTTRSGRCARGGTSAWWPGCTPNSRWRPGPWTGAGGSPTSARGTRSRA